MPLLAPGAIYCILGRLAAMPQVARYRSTKCSFQLLIHPCPAMYLLYIGWPVLNQLAVASFYFSLAEPLRPKVYAALLLGYTIHFIYCIWGNLRIAAGFSD